MSRLTAEIPLDRIAQIKLYINAAHLSLAAIKAETGADYVLNGGLYDMSRWAAVCHLRADGYIYAEDPYSYWGYAWDTGPDIRMQLVPDAARRNYICCVALITATGPVASVSDSGATGGKRGRTAVGLKGDRLCLYVSGDGTADAKTPTALRDELAALGWTSALMLDGGGSSQCDFVGQRITSSRAVHNLILVHLRKEDKPVDGVTQRYMAKNPCCTNGRTITPKGVMIHSTGAPGLMAAALRSRWDNAAAEVSVHAMVDNTITLQTLPWTARAWHCGASANNTHIAMEICEPQETRLLPANWSPLYQGARGMDAWAVKRWQSELRRMGLYAGAIDGSFGPQTKAATIAAQKAVGLEQDGSCGKLTLAAAAGQDGSLMVYPASEIRGYFEAAYARAVDLTARLCIEYGIDPLTGVLCHSEGYAAGIASNHADVMHWFPAHGKTMDDFRTAVAEAMAPAMTLAEAVDALARAGVITAPDYWLGGDYSAANVQALIVRMASAVQK